MKRVDYVAQTVTGKTIAIRDEFIRGAYYVQDSAIEIKVDWATYGELGQWMVAYRKGNTVSKEEFAKRSLMDWETSMIHGGGLWLYTLSGTNEKFDPINHDIRLPAATPYTDIIHKGILAKWDDEVRILSYYTGRQGIIVITVFDKAAGEAMMSFTCLELFGNYRAK